MATENQRYVTVSRQKRFWASIVKFFCVIDGVIVAELKNGKTIRFPVSTERHEFFIYASLTAGEFYSNKITIEADSLDRIFLLNIKSGWWNGTGKTKYWLAQQLGTSWQNVDKFVNNQTKSITYERIQALCEIFDCTPNDLFTLD